MLKKIILALHPDKIGTIIFFLTLFFFSAQVSFAGMGPPMGPPPCWPPPCSVPLDGGISLLIAAGVGLAGKKLYSFRKTKKENPLV